MKKSNETCNNDGSRVELSASCSNQAARQKLPSPDYAPLGLIPFWLRIAQPALPIYKKYCPPGQVTPALSHQMRNSERD